MIKTMNKLTDIAEKNFIHQEWVTGQIRLQKNFHNIRVAMDILAAAMRSAVANDMGSFETEFFPYDHSL